MTRPKREEVTPPPKEQPRKVDKKGDGSGSTGNTDDGKRGRDRDRGAPVEDGE